ncbi:MAG TPA: acyltransferase [Caulobacterales bacterium]|nr:acyltransferase [Caulobacterales bacterium]
MKRAKLAAEASQLMVAIEHAPDLAATSARASARADGYMPQIDTLRAIAVASVMFEHYLPYQFHKLGLIDGVLLFFAISGFLITGILLNYRAEAARGGAGLRHALGVFYARRTLRIFPAYYLLLFILLVLGFAGVEGNFLWHFTYTTNIWTALSGRWDTIAGHFWSLSVEEQFYLCWPLAALTAPRRALPWIMGIGVLAGVAFRAAALQFHWGLAIITLPMANFDALLGGGLLAWLQWGDKQGALAVLRRWGWLSMPLIPVFFYTPSALKDVLMPSAMALASVYVIDQCSTGYRGVLGWLFSRPLILYLGKISYGLYLYHYVVRLFVPDEWFNVMGPFKDYGRAVVFGLMSITCAMLSWHLFEQPINRLKSRFKIRSASQSAAHSPAP